MYFVFLNDPLDCVEFRLKSKSGLNWDAALDRLQVTKPKETT